MVRQHRIVVIGGGPAGIGAGLALEDRGCVLEAGNEPGGLSSTIELDGAFFDLGGHSFHTPHPEVRELVFNALEMYEQKREAWCYSHGELIPYPFQAHFRQLPDPEVVEQCAAGLTQADGGNGAADFEEFLVRRFGPGIAEHFLIPYNRKLWGPNLRRLAADWVGERVASSESSQEKFDERGGKRKPLQTNTTVAYPARGGFGEIMRALAGRLPDLRLGQEVAEIDPLRKSLTLRDGQSMRWDQLISTMSIHQLLALLPDVPAELAAEAERLQILSLALVLVVVGHPVDSPIQRIYCAGPELPSHKTALNHNSSPYLRSLPHHGVLAEISVDPARPLATDDLQRRVIKGLLKTGVIQSADEVRTTKVIKMPNGYPVPTHDRDAIMGRIKAWLTERGIHTLGRFGEWAYINSDEALSRGLMLGRMLRNS